MHSKDQQTLIRPKVINHFNKEYRLLSIIYVLIPVAILLVTLAIGMFFWAVKSDQFEDLERQGSSILFDDDVDKQTTDGKDVTKNSAEH